MLRLGLQLSRSIIFLASKEVKAVALSATLLSAFACQTTVAPDLAVPSDVDLVITKQDQVAKNPSAYVGKKIFVQGQVKELLTDSAFILDYAGPWRKNQLLVIRPEDPQGGGLVKDKTVDVIGEIHLFNMVEMERQLGRKLDAQLFQRYQNQPFVLSTSMLTH